MARKQVPTLGLVFERERDDNEIHPGLIKRIKTYIGTTTPKDGVRNKDLLKGNIKEGRKTNTLIEILCASLAVKGYTSSSISQYLKEVFSVDIAPRTVRKAVKKVLMSKRKRYFLNRSLPELPQG